MKKLFSSMMFVALVAMTFTACEDVPEPYDKPGTGSNAIGGGDDIDGGEGDGSLANPFNSVAALNYGKNLASGQTSEGYMYVKGKVVSIKEEFTTNYGNGTFYISDDGTTTNQFYAYRVLYLGNKKFATGDDQIKVGDEVIVCGIITNYNGTIETAQNKGFLYSLNGVNRGGEPGGGGGDSGEAKGSGTLADPYNAQAAINYTKSLAADTESETEIYIKGKVSTIKNNYVADDYGNATFYISDDGTTTNEFYCFRTLYLGNAKYTSGALLNVGDEVIICGKVVNYKGNTPETVSNKSYLYSLNGSTEAGGDTPTPTPDPTGPNILTNGDFENWTEGQPDHWKTASAAGNATLTQSTDAHGGSYSVSVGFNTSSNKRLGHEEITLKAGTYKFSFYAKSTTADKSQTRAGYVDVVDGTANSSGYKYGSYVSLSNTEWTEVSTTFTLSATTTVSLIMMNPKSSDYAVAQDILVDDATLVTSDGGIE